MKVIQFRDYGGPEVLHAAEVTMPQPGPGEVRIKVAATAVNPADPKWRQGMFKDAIPVPLPHVVGYDVAGTVDAQGEGVGAFPVSTRVVTMLNALTKGGYAEYVCAPAEHCVQIPEGLAFEAAAAIPTAGLTGVQIVEEHADPGKGDLVLVTGATGAVGRFAVHAALQRGARVVAAVRSGQVDLSRKLGADHAIVLGEQGWVGAEFDHVVDTVGGAEVAALCQRLAAGGTIKTAATTPIPAEGLSAVPEFIAVHADAPRLAQLAEDAAAGRIEVPVARVMPLDHAAEAHRLVEAGGTGGKIVLKP